MVQHTSAEGIGDIYAFNTDKFKAESLSVFWALPADKEDSVARSLLLSTLKRGSRNHPTQKLLSKKLDELYATILIPKNRRVSNTHLLGFNADVIARDYTDGKEDFLPRVMSLMCEMMFSPLLDEKGMLLSDYVESEKQNYKDIVLSQINDPMTYASLRCREEILSSFDEGYKLSELCREIDGMDNEKLTEYYNGVVKNSKLVIFYVGSKSIEEIEAAVSSIFPRRELSELSFDDKIKRLENKSEVKYLSEERNSSQSRLVLGMNTQVNWFDSDVYATMLCNEILGVSSISKLMMNIREKLGLCYDCSSSYDMTHGIIFVSCGIDLESFEKTKAAICHEIEELKNGKITEAELEAGKKSIKRTYISVFDSPPAIERVFLGRMTAGLDTNIDNIINAVDSLTAADVARAAKKLSYDTLFLLKADGREEAAYE